LGELPINRVKEQALTKTEPNPPTLEPRAKSTFWALKNLPPFPVVATKLLQIASKEDVNLSEVGQLIAAEPVLSAEVLQVANSALFGLPCQVKSISQAILILGLERIKGISLTRAFGGYLKPALRTEALSRCWQNSLAGALLAEKLAPGCDMNPDIAYTAGLLRDIGRLVLLVKYPAPSANLLAVAQENGFDLMAAERDLFDVDHCQAGTILISGMTLPPELHAVVSRHHEDLSAEPFALVHLVQAADLLADELGFGVLMTPEPRESDVTGALQRLPEGARSRFADCEKLQQEISSRIQILSQK
jgi:HD-like signal output (HDOD) protein